MSSKMVSKKKMKTWTKIKLKIGRDQIGLMVGKKGAVLFGDIQSPAIEEYLEKVNEDGKMKISKFNTKFTVEFPKENKDPEDTKVYVRWTCPLIIQKSDTMDRSVFDKIVQKHILKVQSRILNLKKMVKYEKTFRVRAYYEYAGTRRCSMFIGNEGENVNKLKKDIKDILGLKGLVWVNIDADGDEEIKYLFDFDSEEDTDDSAFFTIKFSYLEEESVSDAEIEKILIDFIEGFYEAEATDSDDESILGEF
jgi:hypothetical protein